MYRRILLSAAVLFIITGLVFPQIRNKVQHSQKIKEDKQITSFSKNNYLPKFSFKKINDAVQIFSTSYDYAGNNSIPNMLEMYDFDGDGVKDVVVTGMQRVDTGTRTQLLAVGNNAGFTTIPFSGGGFGFLQMANAGPLAGNALVTFHSARSSWLFKVDMTSFNVTAPSKPIISGNFPSFAYSNSGEMYFTNTDAVSCINL